MPPYRGQEQRIDMYYFKFIRTGKKLFTTRPDDLITPHNVLAEEDGILQKIQDLRKTDRNALDAGRGFLAINPQRSEILIFGASDGLGLPEDKIAREATIAEFKEQNPTFKILTGRE